MESVCDARKWPTPDDGRRPASPQDAGSTHARGLFPARVRAHGGKPLTASARLASRAGLDEKVVIACLLHDIAMAGLVTADHGYWGAQVIERYVDEEVSWAVRHHQALRYFPDESVGYSYPDAYIRYFGEDYSRRTTFAKCTSRRAGTNGT